MERTYNELVQLKTFDERFEYLKVHAPVGLDTFGFDRYLNQKFYHSNEWRKIRDMIIVRDQGCDLGIEGREIGGKIYIHHMNPMTISDLNEEFNKVIDPDNLVCCSLATHNAIHYGDISSTYQEPVERKPNDTCPWKK